MKNYLLDTNIVSYLDKEDTYEYKQIINKITFT